MEGYKGENYSEIETQVLSLENPQNTSSLTVFLHCQVITDKLRKVKFLTPAMTIELVGVTLVEIAPTTKFAPYSTGKG